MNWTIKKASDLAKELEKKYKNVSIPILEKEPSSNLDDIDDEILVGIVFYQNDDGQAKISDVINYVINEGHIKATHEEIKRHLIQLQNKERLVLIYNPALSTDKDTKYNINTGSQPKNMVSLNKQQRETNVKISQ